MSPRLLGDSLVLIRAVRALPVVLLLLTFGCSRVSPESSSNKFFVDWLQSHSETNVVVDADGVGIAGSPTRLRSSLYESTEHEGGGATVEMEFCIRLPDGREIVEYVVGVGNSPEGARQSANANFVLSTFHVVYRSFMNPADPHQTEESVTIQGQPRAVVMGDILTISDTNTAPDLSELQPRFRELLSPLPLSPGAHWMKIVYAQNHSNALTCAVTLDNRDHNALSEAARKLPWPAQEDFYMAKQFIVIK